MAVKIKTVSKRNPRDLVAPVKFYAQAVADGSVDLNDLAEIIATQCTVSKADCYAVLIALEGNIIRELKKGRIIRLGELGSFQIGISSEPSINLEEVSATSVKKARINFRPGFGLRSMLKNLVYKKAQDQVA